MPREFNIFGPVYPDKHYHVNRLAVKAQIKHKIDQGRYFTLNAARQMGKTTLFREVIAELTTTYDYFGILLSFEALRNYTSERFYEQLSKIIRTQFLSGSPEFTTDNLIFADHGDFGDWLNQTVAQTQRKGILMIDEFDAIGPELAEPILATFRDMYLSRDMPDYYALQSIILVGVRNISYLLGGTQSPFNIADQYEVPYFNQAETIDLLTQHTTETGQPFAPAVLEAVYRESEGQPFLVNRLAQILTQELGLSPSQPIEIPQFKEALDTLLSENNTHFASITHKATPHRNILLPILFYDKRRSEFRDSVTQELIMYGVLRRVKKHNHWQARIANPIYRKMLILTFTPPDNAILPEMNGSFRHRYVVEGILDFERLLTSFQQMMQEHGITLVRSKKTERPLEIGGQYLLLSYLTAALDTIGGYVTLESVNSAGEMDLVVFYQGTRFIIETKIWYGAKLFAEGQIQLAGYLQAAAQDKGYIVLFSEQELPDLPTVVMAAGKQISIYIIVIGR